MKVVINSCFGGFGLSLRGQEEYLKLIGKEAFFYARTKCSYKDGVEEHTKVGVDHNESLFIYTLTKDFGDTYGKLTEDEMDEYFFSDDDIERTDPNLIAVVEKLGEEADGNFASLSIIEIPDGINWEIDEYDGMESVDEVHRSWN